MQHNYKENCIQKVPIFSKLSIKEMIEVSMTTTHKEYKKGETIYLEGELSEILFVINKGKVKIFNISEDGKEQIIRILGVGDFMGELSLFTKYPLKNNAEAIEATSICIIYSKNINELIEKNPSIALKIIKELSVRLETTEEMIESLRHKDVEQRVADILIKLADENNVINLSISKKDLAAYIGMSQETLSRKLSKFQEGDLISQEGQRKIVILDIVTLSKISKKIQ
ncbi:MAG: Crp/Fnr family transcriptional regulator [Clostridiaceae bacterium]